MADFTTNYLNALAQGGRDAATAQHRNALLDMQRQGQAFDQNMATQRLDLARQQARQNMDLALRDMDARTAAREAEGAMRLGGIFRTAHDAGDFTGMTTVAHEMGLPVEAVTPENVDQVMGLVLGGIDALQGWQSATPAPAKAQSAPGKVQADINAGLLPDSTPLADPADEYARYAAEEAAAGRQPLSRIEYKRAGNLRQNISVGPDGSVRISEGYGDQDIEVGLNPSSPESMISSIDGIINDPALDVSTGLLAFTQALPGTPMRRVGAKVKQLDGQAFLQAFESLKGGGQITEIEGIKATQAIGRLDSAQRTEDYVAALEELRGYLSTAVSRPKGWVDQQRRAGQSPFRAEDVQSMSPEQIIGLGPDALRRIPVTELQGLTDEQWDALEALSQ